MAGHNRTKESTRLIHSETPDSIPPRTPSPSIQRGSTVLLPKCDDLYNSSSATYGRGGLATHDALRQSLKALEQAEEAFLYPSGLAAITGTLLALTSQGDEVLISDSVYNPTRRFLSGTLARFGVTAKYFDPSTDASGIADMISPATRLIFLESPGSLTFELQDVPVITHMARRKGILTVIDNTWSAGVLFKPLNHGVDVSIQSLTKYVCGHSDVFMGLAAAQGPAVELLAKSHYETGWAVSPDDAYMAQRGLRTLHTRLAQHGAAGLKVATWLAAQPEVHSVLCPALPDFPNHDIWKRDFSGICGLFGVVLNPVPEKAVEAMLESFQLFGLGYSWGGFESLVIPSDPQLEARTCTGKFPGPLLRFHIGLEDVDDLIEELRLGLRQLSSFTDQRREKRTVRG